MPARFKPEPPQTMGDSQFSLLEKQQLFCKLLAKLITWVFDQGWALTLGEGYDDDGKGHMPQSLHYSRLAQDLNLFVEGKYVTGHSPAWDAIGAKWLSLHPLCRWGGLFASKDYNHVSVFHGGRA